VDAMDDFFIVVINNKLQMLLLKFTHVMLLWILEVKFWCRILKKHGFWCRTLNIHDFGVTH
jgi:hypothetical protein